MHTNLPTFKRAAPNRVRKPRVADRRSGGCALRIAQGRVRGPMRWEDARTNAPGWCAGQCAGKIARANGGGSSWQRAPHRTSAPRGTGCARGNECAGWSPLRCRPAHATARGPSPRRRSPCNAAQTLKQACNAPRPSHEPHVAPGGKSLRTSPYAAASAWLTASPRDPPPSCARSRHCLRLIAALLVLAPHRAAALVTRSHRFTRQRASAPRREVHPFPAPRRSNFLNYFRTPPLTNSALTLHRTGGRKNSRRCWSPAAL